MMWKTIQNKLIRNARLNHQDWFWLKLTQNKYAKVDLSDAAKILKHGPWHVNKDSPTRFYVCGNVQGRRTYLHRFLTGTDDPSLIVDHINNDTLDNRKNNLRVVTKQQNNQNASPQKRSSSSYKGVSWHKGKQKWQARITHKGQRIYLGNYDSEHDAARAYNQAAKRIFGEYAYLNKESEP